MLYTIIGDHGDYQLAQLMVLRISAFWIMDAPS